MANIPSPASYTKLNDVQISNDAGITEALFYQIGEQINKLIDDIGDLKTANDKTITNASYSSQTITPGSSLSLLTYSVSSNQNPVFLKLSLTAVMNRGSDLYLKNNTTDTILEQYTTVNTGSSLNEIYTSVNVYTYARPHNQVSSYDFDPGGGPGYTHYAMITAPATTIDVSPNSGNNLYVLKNDSGSAKNVSITSVSVSVFEI